MFKRIKVFLGFKDLYAIIIFYFTLTIISPGYLFVFHSHAAGNISHDHYGGRLFANFIQLVFHGHIHNTQSKTPNHQSKKHVHSQNELLTSKPVIFSINTFKVSFVIASQYNKRLIDRIFVSENRQRGPPQV